jgi:uncharacterized protein (DUF885 family)
MFPLTVFPFRKLIYLGVVMSVFATNASVYSAVPEASNPATAKAVGQINAQADELLKHLQETSAYARLQSKLPITRLDDFTVEQAARESTFSRVHLKQMDQIALAGVPHEQWLLAQLLRHTFDSGVHTEDDYWLTFAVTPYSGGWLILTNMTRILAAQPLTDAAGRENYLHLVDEYARVLAEIAAKTKAQATRGIRVPKPALAGVRATWTGVRDTAPQTLAVSEARLQSVPAEVRSSFSNAVAKRVNERVVPACEAILAIFDESYSSKAPAGVGISQYPGGPESYLRRIVNETGLKLTPQQIHDHGLAVVAELEARMQSIRTEVGFKGDRSAFDQMLRKDPRFVAKSPAELEQQYLLDLKRIEPQIPKFFSRLPRAPYGVKRLELANEAGMTFGYYQHPTVAEPMGYYRYNGSNQDERSLPLAAHLIFHELVPGHHFQIALQQENKDVHPVREFIHYSSFAEGWAEYAAELAAEMGGYVDPYERYGHLLTQEFLATRLVVDTGMNALGWSLERARQYMRDHTFETDALIGTESLRYSTDLYGQALGYRLGYDQFWSSRHKAEAALGSRFDIRAFHAVAMGEGSMPLDLLGENVDWFIAQQKSPHP